MTVAAVGRAPTVRGWLRDLARGAAGPAICAIALTGLLSGWVAIGGAGALTRVRIQVSLAAIPMRGFTVGTSTGPAHTYLAIRNLAGTPDQLIAASSPIARQTELTVRAGPGDLRTVVPSLAIPAHGTLTLSPLGDDVVIISPRAYEDDGSVPLTLTFRRAGRITVDAAVTAPGAP